MLKRLFRSCSSVLLLALWSLLWVPAALARDCPPEPAPPTPEQLREVARAATDRGFLWRIEKDGRHSHLYGTLHVGRLAWAVPGERTTEALKGSAVLALELDPTDTATQGALLQRITQPLKTPLPAPLLTRLQRQAESDCLPWAGLEPLRPELQLATLALVSARRQGLQPEFGSELVLLAAARQWDKPVHALETADEQAIALLLDDESLLPELVEASLDELDSGRAVAMMQQLATAWAERDARRMETYEQWCECMNTEAERALMQRLLDERNTRLAERIDALHAKSGPVFVAVGALHLFGPQGLPALLKARGYRVEQVF